MNFKIRGRSFKKVCFFTTDSKPHVGGAAEYLHGLCEALGKSYEVELYSTVDCCEEYPRAHYKAKQLKSRPVRNLGDRLWDRLTPLRKLNTWLYFRQLEKMAVHEIGTLITKDSLVLISYWPPDSHFWCRACQMLRIPYLVICHGLELVYSLKGLPKRWRKKDVQRAFMLITNSRPTGELARIVCGKEIGYTVLNPGIDPNSCREPSSQQLLAKRVELGLPEASFVLLSVGYLTKRKGFDLALQAFAELRHEFPGLYYLIAGDGPERDYLKQLAHVLGADSKIRFIPKADDEEKWLLYGLSDLFIMPNRTLEGSDWEGFGIVFLEAALAGKPSLGGNNGGVPDAVVHGSTGLLVNTCDYLETKEALASLIRDQAKRKQMGEAARQRVLKSFTWDFLVQGLVQRCND